MELRRGILVRLVLGVEVSRKPRVDFEQVLSVEPSDFFLPRCNLVLLVALQRAELLPSLLWVLFLQRPLLDE